MRLVLRKYNHLGIGLPNNRYCLSQRARSRRSSRAKNEALSQAIGQKGIEEIQKIYQEKVDSAQEEESEQAVALGEWSAEKGWAIAAEHMLQPASGLSEVERTKLAQKKLQEYQELNHTRFKYALTQRLQPQDSIKSALARVGLKQMNHISDHFLDSGVDFVTSHSLQFMMRKGKLGIIKKLLVRNTLEKIRFLDNYEVEMILTIAGSHKRNWVLYNLLCYEKNLLQGKPIHPVHVHDYLQVQDMIREGVIHSERSDDINRLRLIWSCNKLYLVRRDEVDFVPELVTETNKVRLEGPNADSGEIRRELAHITGSAFGRDLWSAFVGDLFHVTDTFNEYLRAYAISTMILSKLLAFDGLLPQDKAMELCTLFQLAEVNLPKPVRNDLFKKHIPWLLNRKHHYNQLQNYRRCYNYYQFDHEHKENDENPKTITALSFLVEQYSVQLQQDLKKSKLHLQRSPISIVYQQQPTAKPHAQSRVFLEMKEETDSNSTPFQSQASAISDIIRGNYKPGLDYFMTTFPINNNPSVTEEFSKAVSNADETLKFQDENTEAFYKLKLAHQAFFSDSLPQPLGPEDLYKKVNYNTSMVLDGNGPIEPETDVDGHDELAHRNFMFTEFGPNIKVQDFAQYIMDNNFLTKRDKLFNKQDLEVQELQGEEGSAQEVEAQEGQQYEAAAEQTGQEGVQEAAQQAVAEEEAVEEGSEQQGAQGEELQAAEEQGEYQEQGEAAEEVDPFDTEHIRKHYDQKDIQKGRELMNNNYDQLLAEYHGWLYKVWMNYRTEGTAPKQYALKMKEKIKEARAQRTYFHYERELRNIKQLEKNEQAMNEYIKRVKNEHPNFEKKTQRDLKKVIEDIWEGRRTENYLERFGLEWMQIDWEQLMSKFEKEKLSQNGNLRYGESEEESSEIQAGPGNGKFIKQSQIHDLIRTLMNEQTEEESTDKHLNDLLQADQGEQIQKYIKNLQKQVEQQALQEQQDEDLEIEQSESFSMDITEQQSTDTALQYESVDTIELQDQMMAQIEKEKQTRKKQLLQFIKDFPDDTLSPKQKKAYDRLREVLESNTQIVQDIDSQDDLPEKYQEYLSEDDRIRQIIQHQRREVKEKARMGQQDEYQQQKAHQKKKGLFSFQSPSESFDFEKPEVSRPKDKGNNNRPRKTVGTPLFGRKNKYGFGTAIEEGELVAAEEEPETKVRLGVEEVEKMRDQSISRELLKQVRSEVGIAEVGSGSTVAKYLFLHSKPGPRKVQPQPGKTLQVQFPSAIGTVAKSFQKYLDRTLFNYQLEQSFYTEILTDLLTSYSRFNFKLVIAHLVNFHSELSPAIIDLVCRICTIQRIGYTFAEIAHLLLVNNIRIGKEGLKMISDTWRKFEVINEDVLVYIRDYCRKFGMPLETCYHEPYTASLIKTNRFDKLEILVKVILAEIQPKPFKIPPSAKASEVAQLEREWKVKQQQNYILGFYEIIDVIIHHLKQKIPEFLPPLFDEFKKLQPQLTQRQLASAFICYSFQRTKFEEMMAILTDQPQKATPFMFDCIEKALLNNLSELEDLTEKILELTIERSRFTLTDEQVDKTILLFRKIESSNAYSKFLEHCLRFQPKIYLNKKHRQGMYWIMNNNVEENSVGGIFNMLQFIFDEKREKQRVQFRAVKLSEEEKQRKLLEIQQGTEEVKIKANGEQGLVQQEEQKEFEAKEVKEEEQQTLSKRALKKAESNRQKIREKKRMNKMARQILNEQAQAVTTQSTPAEIISLIKGQTKKHVSKRRKGMTTPMRLFNSDIELIKQQEAKAKEEAENKGKGKVKAKK